MSNRETQLLNKLEKLSLETKKTIKELKEINKAMGHPTEDQEQNEVLRIGDTVRIKNPRFGQKTTGTITRIGSTFITITTLDGKKVNRVPKNVTRHTQDNGKP